MGFQKGWRLSVTRTGHQQKGAGMDHSWILAGDIGGTKTALGLFSPVALEKAVSSGTLATPAISERYSSHEYPGLSPIVSDFLEKNRGVVMDQPVWATFGVAGPVLDNRCETTNLPWVIEGSVLEKNFSWQRGSVWLVNDLVAMGWGINLVRGAGGILWLRKGPEGARGNAVLVAPGTGLGEALLEDDHEKLKPWASEGGHTDWAPVNSLQVRLLEFLWKRFPHVSSERLLSGPGLLNIYRFVSQDGPHQPNLLDQNLPEEHLPEKITERAIAGEDPCAEAALRLFADILAQEVGNMALKVLATGGVFLGGGIPGKILPFLREPSFLAHMADKGRYREFLGQIPVGVLTHEETPLLGAAYQAYLRFRGEL